MSLLYLLTRATGVTARAPLAPFGDGTFGIFGLEPPMVSLTTLQTQLISNCPHYSVIVTLPITLQYLHCLCRHHRFRSPWKTSSCHTLPGTLVGPSGPRSRCCSGQGTCTSGCVSGILAGYIRKSSQTSRPTPIVSSPLGARMVILTLEINLADI